MLPVAGSEKAENCPHDAGDAVAEEPEEMWLTSPSATTPAATTPATPNIAFLRTSSARRSSHTIIICQPTRCSSSDIPARWHSRNIYRSASSGPPPPSPTSQRAHHEQDEDDCAGHRSTGS